MSKVTSTKRTARKANARVSSTRRHVARSTKPRSTRLDSKSLNQAKRARNAGRVVPAETRRGEPGKKRPPAVPARTRPSEKPKPSIALSKRSPREALAGPEPQFVIERGALVGAFRATARTLSPRSHLPILGTYLIEADQNAQCLRVVSTNLETFTWVLVPAAVAESGSFCAPRVTLDLLAAWVVGEPDQVTLSVNGKAGTALLSSASALNARLRGLPASEFPVLPTLAPEFTLTLARDDLSEIAERVARFASRDAARPVLTGVLVEARPTQSADVAEVAFVAADGFRLGVVEKKLPVEWTSKNPGPASQALVPSSLFGEIRRILAQSDAESVEFKIASQASQVSFETPLGGVVGHLIDGTYPDWRRLVPNTPLQIPFASAQELLRAMRVGGIFAGEGETSLHLSVDPKRNRVKVSAASSTLGDSVDYVGANFKDLGKEKTPATGLELAFNAEYLIDAIQAVAFGSTKDIPLALGVSDPTAPCRFKTGRFTTVIMPMVIDRAGQKIHAASSENEARVAAPAPSATEEDQLVDAAVQEDAAIAPAGQPAG